MLRAGHGAADAGRLKAVEHSSIVVGTVAISGPTRGRLAYDVKCAAILPLCAGIPHFDPVAIPGSNTRYPYRIADVHGYTSDKEAYLTRLRRIEGQIRGLQRMVDEDVYCIDVLTQVSAATRALQSVALGLLEDHLSHCVAEAVERGGPEAEEKVKEASAAIARLVRS